MVQYNLHYLVKKNAHSNSSHFKWSNKNYTTHLFLTGAGMFSLIIALFNFKLHHYLLLLVFGIITLLYSLPVLPLANKKRLKDFGILKIIMLVLLWTLVTVWFPVDQVNIKDTSFILIFIRRFIFLFALCLVFDIRDIEIDTIEKIKTIPIIIGVTKTYILSYILLSLFILISLIQHLQVHDPGQLNAMMLSAGATFVMIEYIKKNKSDITYLACIDGMMLLQAMLVIIGSI